MYFITTKFHKFFWAVSEELRWQEEQDWMTDWLTDGQVKNVIPSATHKNIWCCDPREVSELCFADNFLINCNIFNKSILHRMTTTSHYTFASKYFASTNTRMNNMWVTNVTLA